MTDINTKAQGSVSSQQCALKGPCFEDSTNCLHRLKRDLKTVLSGPCIPVPTGRESRTEPQLEFDPHNSTSTVENHATNKRVKGRNLEIPTQEIRLCL